MAAKQIIFDYREAGLDPQDHGLCDYAIKLTLHPEAASAEDIEGLRRVGFSDEEITMAVQVIGYFNYINRVADGLGVDPEGWMELSREEWDRRRTSKWE